MPDHAPRGVIELDIPQCTGATANLIGAGIGSRRVRQCDHERAAIAHARRSAAFGSIGLVASKADSDHIRWRVRFVPENGHLAARAECSSSRV
jgi:hypothetical protein